MCNARARYTFSLEGDYVRTSNARLVEEPPSGLTRSEDDHQPPSDSASGQLALRVRRPLGRKGLRYPQGELALGDQMSQPIERFMLVQVRGHPHRLDRDASFRWAGESAHGGELAAVPDGGQD